MHTLHLAKALLPDGWARDVRLEVGPEGTILDVRAQATVNGAERLPGVTLPGMIDLHCHSFQRAMAGLAERLSGSATDFWGWRGVMYDFLARIGPDELWAITAQLYVELLKGGYTSVCEFHYLHNDPAGGAYDDPAMLGIVIHEAAAAAGIGLTLLPALYLTGGFGDRPAEPTQRRFLSTPDGYLRRLERLDEIFRDQGDRRLGMAPHSLRAVPLLILSEIVAACRDRDPFVPVHIHVAEQQKEVADCLAWSGARPVRLLLDQLGPDHRWCLVHCTHLDEAELDGIAASGAVVGLCPTTEANLGDGVFRLAEHLARGGRIGIGSDSNVCRSWAQELRMLEYGQRLLHRRRTVAATEAEPSSGSALLSRALAGGAQAAGRLVGRIAPGARADLVVLDAGDPALVGRGDDLLVDALVFAADCLPVRHVMVSGQWRIRDGAHAAERSIANSYRRAVRKLAA